MQELERQFKADGGTFEEYRIGELFDISTPKKKFNANAIEFGTKYRYVVRTSQNNGIRGYLDEDEKYLNPANTISFGQDTATIFYQDQPYFTGDKIKIMRFLLNELNPTIACYLLSAMNKSFSTFQWGQSSFDVDILINVIISLPTFVGEISFAYMESFIRELQNERLSKLNDYLKESGLENTELSQEEKDTVLRLRDGCVKWQDFKIGDLFEPLKVGYIGKGKKIGSAKKNKTKEYCIPLTCAKIGDNGIMYWAKEGDFITYENALSVIADGAVSAGLVYAQPEKAGAYSHSYFIKIKNLKIPFEVNIFLSAILTKVIYPQYSRDRSPRWERICNEVIFLPVTPDGEIDWDFMQNLISAESRLAIRGVVEWKKSIDK